jgi:hypothetical protein
MAGGFRCARQEAPPNRPETSLRGHDWALTGQRHHRPARAARVVASGPRGKHANIWCIDERFS